MLRDMKRERQHRGTWDNNAELRFPMEAGLTVDCQRDCHLLQILVSPGHSALGIGANLREL